MVEVRADAAATALRRLLGDGRSEQLAVDVPSVTAAAIDRGSAAGRPLFAANREVPEPDDPVAALWQVATTLREHRGDGHVAVLAAAGLDGCESLVGTDPG